MEEQFISLKNRIWKSYKSRINTAERLKKNHEFIAFLSIYYSAVLSAVSILNFINKSQKMEIFSIVLSVMVTILFLFFEGRNYKERYIKMKENYNNLNLLFYEIDRIINSKKMSEENFKQISEKYIKLLNSVENHLECDYIKYLIDEKGNFIESKKIIKYYFDKLCILGIKIIGFSIPTYFLGVALFQMIV